MKVNKLIHDQLLTNRLIISELTQDDGNFVCELCNSPGWLKYIGDRNIKDENDAYAMLQERYLPSYSKLGYGMYKVSLSENQRPVGMCGLMQRDYLDAPDLGFAILPDYTRKGYIFEACTELIIRIKESMELKKIYGVTSVLNFNSRNLLKKLGFQMVNEIVLPAPDGTLFKYVY